MHWLIPYAFAAASDLPGPIVTPGTIGGTACILPLVCPAAGAAGLAGYIATVIFNGMRSVFIGVGFIMFLWYGVRLMIESNEESTIAEVKQAYSYGIAGAVIVGIVNLIVLAIGQGNESQLINSAAAAEAFGTIVLFFRLMVATALAGLIVFQGMRLIILQGDEAEFENQRKRFVQSLIGVTVILLANILVTAFAAPMGGGSGNSMSVVVEIIGIINFLLTIAGALALIVVIVGGLFLIVSVDEALKDRAKKAIVGAIITMIILLLVSTIIRFVIQVGAAGTP